MTLDTLSVADIRSRFALSKRHIMRVLRIAIIVLVVVFLGRYLRTLYQDLTDHSGTLSRMTLGWRWIALSVLFFGLGQVCFASLWQRLLGQAGAPQNRVHSCVSTSTVGWYSD